MVLFSLITCLMIFLALGIPIGICLGLATAITLIFSGNIPLIMLSQNTVTALDSFPLLAVPFFMLAGSLMTYGGISKRLINMADSLVGYLTGALGMITVLSCMFFAALSGSGPATVSAIGSFMVPAMKEKKYDKGFAAAIIASAGSIGVIIPPSIPFVIYGVVANVSVGEMFLAGVIPGIIIGLGLMIGVYFVAKKRNYPKGEIKPTLKNILINLKESIWALMVPIIILGGIYGGIFTPTEAAVVAVVYSLIIGKFVYKELDFKKIYDAFRFTCLINGATLFMVGLSMSFARYMTMLQIPMKVAGALESVSNNYIVIFILINLFFLSIGCFIDNISSMLILTPIFLPVVIKFGMDPVHFGVVMTVALAIGFVTPPYGANLFIASSIAGVKIEEIIKYAVIFIGILIVCLLLIVFIPGLSMGLVNLFIR